MYTYLSTFVVRKIPNSLFYIFYIHVTGTLLKEKHFTVRDFKVKVYLLRVSRFTTNKLYLFGRYLRPNKR